MRFIWRPNSPFIGQIPVTTTTAHTLSPNPRPHFHKEPPCLDQPIPSHTENWLVAILRKHLQTAWDLVSQTRLWIRITIHGRQVMRKTLLKKTESIQSEKNNIMEDYDSEHMLTFVRGRVSRWNLAIGIQRRSLPRRAVLPTTVKRFDAPESTYGIPSIAEQQEDKKQSYDQRDSLPSWAVLRNSEKIRINLIHDQLHWNR